jgi:pimeloyl-ACP methyl ester carboxylesterase
MDHTALTFTLPDGRTLGYALYGSSSPDAFQLFYFHSYPCSRLEASILASHALELNIRLICPDRPGIGLSSPQAKRKILDWPADVIALANYLQLPTFSIIAYTLGAQYALACLYALPRERLRGVEIMAGYFPPRLSVVQQVSIVAFKPMYHVLNAGISHAIGSAINFQFGRLAREADPRAFYEECEKDMKLRPEIERTALQGVEKLLLWEPMREALRPDVTGKAFEWEMKLQTGKWGFELNEGCDWSRVTVWHGSADPNVPIDNVMLAVDKMRCELKLLQGQGHAGVLVYYGKTIMEHALQKAR